MQARVKPDHRYAVLIAFTGREFVKSEWRPVPVGMEREAQQHPWLETKTEPEKQSGKTTRRAK
jgi:hypothetical protein